MSEPNLSDALEALKEKIKQIPIPEKGDSKTIHGIGQILPSSAGEETPSLNDAITSLVAASQAKQFTYTVTAAVLGDHLVVKLKDPQNLFVAIRRALEHLVEIWSFLFTAGRMKTEIANDLETLTNFFPGYLATLEAEIKSFDTMYKINGKYIVDEISFQTGMISIGESQVTIEASWATDQAKKGKK
jgi:hypothetical protein